MARGSKTGVIVMMPTKNNLGKIRDDTGTFFEFGMPDERVSVPTGKRKMLLKKGARVLFTPGSGRRAGNIKISISSHQG